MIKRTIGALSAIVVTALLPAIVRGATVEDLTGARGKVFHVNTANKCFDFLKETVHDPATGAATSWHSVAWTDSTTVTKVVELVNFAGVKAPVVVEFPELNDANVKAAAAAGKPIVARLAIVHADCKAPSDMPDNNGKIAGWLTPEAGAAPRGGVVRLNGKDLQVTLARRGAKVLVHERRGLADLATGCWEARLRGQPSDGRFVAQSIEAYPVDDPRLRDDAKLPRVLVIGDSISMNYHAAATEALKGVANYHRIEGNSFSTEFGVKNMEFWLGDYKTKGLHWDVIQFNHGLHDLKQPAPDAKPYVSVETYKQGLKQEIEIMKRTGAVLIWCSTTPVPNDCGSKQFGFRVKGMERTYNEAALEVVCQYPEIQVNDLCAVVNDLTIFDHWRATKDVHYYRAEEQAALGKAVAAAVRKALTRP